MKNSYLKQYQIISEHYHVGLGEAVTLYDIERPKDYVKLATKGKKFDKSLFLELVSEFITPEKIEQAVQFEREYEANRKCFEDKKPYLKSIIRAVFYNASKIKKLETDMLMSIEIYFRDSIKTATEKDIIDHLKYEYRYMINEIVTNELIDKALKKK